MPVFAAIDIGSNSCRLKIARVVAHTLKPLHEDREVTRLGGSVFESGLVSPEAMATTLRALKRFQRAVQDHGVDQIRVVATAAMRDARNGAAFQAWVKAETGWNMEIISGLEEALAGKSVGEKMNVRIEAEHAYGEFMEDRIQVISRDMFDGIDTIEVGMQFHADVSAGPGIVTVIEVAGDDITIDGNHPLAGIPLTFDVEIVHIRPATEEEMEHGHIHGEGGHHH